VIAVKAVPAPFLFALLPFLKPSSPFVIFSPFMQQLVDCYMDLQRTEEAINMQLSETWMRQYQVRARVLSPCRACGAAAHR
jgi:tRNA (adenine-N(1)-)-methyltransferase non-catalytic subunit